MCAALARPTPAAAAAIFILAMARPAREPGHHAVGTHQSGGGLRPKTGCSRMHATHARNIHMTATLPKKCTAGCSLPPSRPAWPAHLPHHRPLQKWPNPRAQQATACSLLSHATAAAVAAALLPPYGVTPPSGVRALSGGVRANPSLRQSLSEPFRAILSLSEPFCDTLRHSCRTHADHQWSAQR